MIPDVEVSPVPKLVCKSWLRNCPTSYFLQVMADFMAADGVCREWSMPTQPCAGCEIFKAGFDRRIALAKLPETKARTIHSLQSTRFSIISRRKHCSLICPRNWIRLSTYLVAKSAKWGWLNPPTAVQMHCRLTLRRLLVEKINYLAQLQSWHFHQIVNHFGLVILVRLRQYPCLLPWKWPP